MLGISGVCSRLVGDIVQALVSGPNPSSACIDSNPDCNLQTNALQVDDLMMIRALTAVFGMENNGKIKKDKARRVIEKLGMIKSGEGEEQNKSGFDLPGSLEDEVPVEEVLSGLEDGSDHRNQLLHEAFKVFDEDGNGYIEAAELKRVLHCLELDKGWEMNDIEKMLKAADLNFDGKVDFSEFELMMS